MKRIFAFITCTALTAACADDIATPVQPETSNTILVGGNVSGPGCPPDPSCLAPIDQQIKKLYERNNALSERGDGTITLEFHGEARYAPASAANNNLATIWLTPEMTPDEAITLLNRYISDVERALRQGNYSQCAANEVITYANWIISLIQQAVAAGGYNSSMLASEPKGRCSLSPVTPTGVSGSTGVTLTIADPWGFQSYYEIRRNGVSLGVTTSTTYLDATAIVAGSYVYEVRQCSANPSIGCGVWTATTVTIGGGGGTPPACVHDNRNGAYVPGVPGPKQCPKDDKIHKNN